ncbi:MAG: Electron transfer flavoprotein subunit beta [Planctomycetes bacterium]|nr:Electron transfer flavoprotein subunit beta [Planctomycetota bacterium]
MHIVVLIKRVPDTTAKVRASADGRSVDATGAESIISPYDEIALERAIQLRESGAATKLTVLCMGPADATKEVRKALAMGADEGVLLVDAAPFRDSAATAATLAAACRELAPQAVFCGWKAIDDDAGVVGGYLAATLGFSFASYATKIDAADGGLAVHREVEGATEVVRVPLPAVVTVQKGLAEPRFAGLKGIMAAKKKPLAEKPAAAPAAAADLVAYQPPPDRPPGRIVGEGAAAVPELVRILREEVHVL